MKILIDIPDNEVPKKQDIVTIKLHFDNGHVCKCDYPSFQEVSPGVYKFVQNVIRSQEFPKLRKGQVIGG